MGQINRIPNGFLDLVGVQSLGKNPPLYSDAISPTVDLTEFYWAQTLSSHTEDFTHGTTGDTVVHFVPEGETWFLRGVGCNATQVATNDWERWEFSLDNLPRAGTGGATSEPNIHTTPMLQLTSLPGETSDAFILPCPLALSSGVALRATLIQRDGGAARTTALDWLMNRMES